MLLSVVYSKNVDQHELLYFEFPISLADRQDAVFTNASANTQAPPTFYVDPIHLDQLDWEAIDNQKWGSPSDDFRHRRMAELLVHHQLPVTAATRCVVWNAGMKSRVEEIVNGAAFPPISFEDRNRRHWFGNLEKKDGTSVVVGPSETWKTYQAVCEYVENNAGSARATAQFANLDTLLAALDANFACLPHTAELVGLQSENGVHRHTVDVHTRDVVQRLRQSPEFRTLDVNSKTLVALAAYLHDIGKGPRARWNNNGGLQRTDPNHPVGAMPMMAEILTAHVGTVDSASARTLMKLVCYHDLIGDVLGKGRDERQIANVVNSRSELDMLFALGKADATSLVENWWSQDDVDGLYNRFVNRV